MNTYESNDPFDNEEKSGSQPIIWITLGIAAMCCGVLFVGALFYFQPNAKSLYAQYFPSSTPTPSRTPPATPTFTPTATNTPTPTPNMTATVQVQNAQSTAENASSNWQVILSDTFDSNKNKWLVEPSDDEYASTTYQVADGKYTWDTTAHQSFINWVRTGKKQLTDFYISVEIQQTDGPDTGDYGIIFREDDNSNFYYFGINEQGQYVLYLYNKEWSTLIDLTQSDLIQPGKTNRITVLGEGSHFTFFINDQYLTEIMDDSIPQGITGLAVELAGKNDHGVFEFDNLDIRAP